MYHSGNNQEEVTSKLSAIADQATRWYKSNPLVGNLKKYQTLSIGYRTETIGSQRASGGTCINNEEIKTAETFKLLVVTIDSRLNFSEYVNSACKKASQRITVLMRLRNLIPIKAKLQLYKADGLPHLTYCYLIWQFCRASDSRKLERLQERGLRVVYNEKQASFLQLLGRAKLPNLMNRRLQDICILMYKVKYKLWPSNICNMFKEHSFKYNLRQSDISLLLGLTL